MLPAENGATFRPVYVLSALVKLLRGVDRCIECPLWAVGSTGERNTLVFRKRWSVLNEVSSQDLLFS